MLLALVTDAHQAVENVLAAVDADMEPGILFKRRRSRDAPEDGHFLSAYILERHPFSTYCLLGLFEESRVVQHKSVSSLPVEIAGVVEKVVLAVEDVMDKEFLHPLRIV